MRDLESPRGKRSRCAEPLRVTSLRSSAPPDCRSRAHESVGRRPRLTSGHSRCPVSVKRCRRPRLARGSGARWRSVASAAFPAPPAGSRTSSEPSVRRSTSTSCVPGGRRARSRSTPTRRSFPSAGWRCARARSYTCPCRGSGVSSASSSWTPPIWAAGLSRRPPSAAPSGLADRSGSRACRRST